MPTSQRGASGLITLFGVLIILSTIVLVMGVYDWLRVEEHSEALFGAGVVSLILSLALLPIALNLHRLVHGGKSPMQDRYDDMITIMRSISDRTSMSDSAKRTTWRHRDLEAIRRAIHQDIEDGKVESALGLTYVLENAYALRGESAKLRGEITQARNAEQEKEVVEAVQTWEQVLNSRDWEKAHAEAKRLELTYPDSPHTSNLTQRVAERREDYKRQLERKFLEANNRNDVEGAMELLKQLDKYLTEREAAQYMEIARGVISKKRQNIGLQFKIAVRDRDDVQALSIAEEIMRDFPNTRMADEVRSVIDKLRERAAVHRQTLGAAEPVA